MKDTWRETLAKKYASESNYTIIIPTDTLEELEDLWNKFKSTMTVRQQRLCDDRSIQIYGLTNQQHYDLLKSKFEKNKPDKQPEETKITPDDSIVNNNNDDDTITTDIDKDFDNLIIDEADANLVAGRNTYVIPDIEGETYEEKLQELEKHYAIYNSLTNDQKRMSDGGARMMYGLTNQERYDMLKAEFLSHIDNSKEIDCTVKPTVSPRAKLEQMMNDPNTFVGQRCMNVMNESKNKEVHRKSRLNNTPYFTPTELIDMGVHGNDNYYSDKADNDGLIKDISVTTWFDSYKDMISQHVYEDYTSEWIQTLYKLYSDYDTIKEYGTEEEILARKQSILDLGWNPEIDFNNPENRIKASKRINSYIDNFVPKDIFIDIDSIVPDEDELETVQEAVSKSTYKPVFIMLTKGRTPVISSSIKNITKSEYSHASISFDESMTNITSFNFRKENFGLAVENIKNLKDIPVTIWMFFADNESVEQMKKKVYDFKTHKTNYDFRMFSRFLLKKDERPDDNIYNQVCSTFVDNVLRTGNVVINPDKNMPSPADIYEGIKMKSNVIFEVYDGPADKYDAKKVRKKINYLLKNENTNAINEACKDVATARKFVKEVEKIAKKYNANYFIVTDGASGIHNNGNPAVKNARDAQVKWEKQNGYDPDEDWSKSIVNEAESSLPSGVTFRKATKADTEYMYKCEMDSIEPSIKNDKKIMKLIKDDVNKSIGSTRIIQYNGEDIGMLTVEYIDDGECFYIGEIYINEEYRERSIGSTIIKNILDSHNKVRLQVAKSNTKAISLYKSLGFKITKYYKRGNMYVMDYEKDKVNESYITEVLNDIKNGVNPYSNKKFYHISFDPDLDEKTLTPRVPDWIVGMKEKDKDFEEKLNSYKTKVNPDGYGYEDPKTPRICFSNSIEGALNAIITPNKRLHLAGKQIYVFTPEKPISEYRHKTNKSIKRDGDVFDANITNEMWILEPCNVKFLGSIIVDKVSAKKRKKFVNNKEMTVTEYSYKWRWYHKISKKEKFNESTSAISIFNEVKKFPIEFDKEGNLIIYRCRTNNIDFDDEIDNSVKLMEVYRNTNNQEGLKYELAKIWYITSEIEKRMKKRNISTEDYNKLVRQRSICMNCFKTNYKYLSKLDNSFNFAVYYNSTPFSDNGIKITGTTLRQGMALAIDTIKTVI